VPLSLTYDANHVLSIGKCTPSTFALDWECANDPYEIVYDIVFHVTANGDPITLNTDLDVRVEIGNTCLADAVAIQNLIDDSNIIVQE
jgi:hypothetical protein